MNLEPLVRALGDRAIANEPMARHTTFRIGGPADLWTRATSVAELGEYVRLARQYLIPVLVVGKGSNVLVREGGVRGLVIENRSDGWELVPAGDGHAVLTVACGASLPLLANRLARRGWAGLEWGIGIPGTFGGAIVGNAGAHGACIATSLQKVRVLDPGGSEFNLPVHELGMGYRQSRFKQSHDWVLLNAEIKLIKADPDECIARMSGYSEQRRRTQPTDPSVGSMFKNPPGDHAGRLIEQAGMKGTRVGGALISPVHANFIVNSGEATARDVLELVEITRAKVKEQFGVSLELEIEVLGDSAG